MLIAAFGKRFVYIRFDFGHLSCLFSDYLADALAGSRSISDSVRRVEMTHKSTSLFAHLSRSFVLDSHTINGIRVILLNGIG